MLDNCFVAGGCSVDFPSLPPEPDLVRAWSYPGCMVLRPIPGRVGVSMFQWVVDCHYGGWVPQCLFDLALPFAQVRASILTNRIGGAWAKMVGRYPVGFVR